MILGFVHYFTIWWVRRNISVSKLLGEESMTCFQKFAQERVIQGTFNFGVSLILLEASFAQSLIFPGASSGRMKLLGR